MNAAHTFESTQESVHCATCGLEDQDHTVRIELIINSGQATVKYPDVEASTWDTKVDDIVASSWNAGVEDVVKISVFDGDTLTLVGTDFMNIDRIVLQTAVVFVAGQNFEITYRGAQHG